MILIISYYAIIGLLFLLPAVTAALGQSYAAQAAEEATSLQPAAAAEIRKTFLLGLALNEAAVIINGVLVVMVCFQKNPLTSALSIGNLALVCALGIPSTVVGIMASRPHAAALKAIARQPFLAKKILNLVLLMLSVLQTPSIFGLLIALAIKSQLLADLSFEVALRFLCAGCAFGIGTIGPIIGLAIFASSACAAVGYNRDVYKQILSFTFISQALIETPIFLALVVTLLILFALDSSTSIWSLCGAAIAIAVSTFGTGIASGSTAAAACTAISLQPEHTQEISRTSMMAQTIIDASAIYGLVIALVLLFVTV